MAKGVAEEDFGITDTLSPEVRAKVLEFYRQVNTRPTCNECGASATQWAEGDWKGFRHTVYACDDGYAQAQGDRAVVEWYYDNVSEWRRL